MATIITEGDLGDIIFTMGVIAGMDSGPHTLLMKKSKLTKYRDDDSVRRLIEFMGPLIRKQPYIKEFRAFKDGENANWDSSGFRLANMHQPTYTLLSAYARNLQAVYPGIKCGDGLSPWITCEPAPGMTGRVVINRTERYQNEFFPWKQVVEHYGDWLLFVGTKIEHEEFVRDFGKVEYQPTKTLLEAAQLIAGSALFIGNQSCANAVVEAMKHPMIQETSLDIPDCIFKRPNAQHVIDGSCVLPALGINGRERIIQRKTVKLSDIDETTVPPNKWVLKLGNGDEIRHVFLNALISEALNNRMTKEDVLRQNAEEYRDYFFNSCYQSRFGAAMAALNNAQ